MQKTLKHEDIKQTLAEADELLWKIEPKFIESIAEEEKRIDLEQQARSLKQLKMEALDKIEKEGIQESGTYSEGMHKAMEDIEKAMKALASYL